MATDEARVNVGWPCPDCDGTGQVQRRAPDLYVERYETVPCVTCSSSGNRKTAWIPLSKLKHMLDDA